MSTRRPSIATLLRAADEPGGGGVVAVGGAHAVGIPVGIGFVVVDGPAAAVVGNNDADHGTPDCGTLLHVAKSVLDDFAYRAGDECSACSSLGGVGEYTGSWQQYWILHYTWRLWTCWNP